HGAWIPWKTAKNAVSHRLHTHHLSLPEKNRTRTEINLRQPSTEPDQAQSRHSVYPSRDRSGLRWGEASGSPARVRHLLRPLLTSAPRSENLAVPSVHRDAVQISRGKLDRLHRTPAESTALALVERTSRKRARSSDQNCLSVFKTYGPLREEFFKTFPPLNLGFFKTFPPLS